MNTSNSEKLFTEAKNYFPGGVNSPVRAFKSVGGTPIFIKKGKGSHIWDADNNEYIDYCCSWGPLILGHANDTVLNAVSETMQNGTSFGAPTELEIKMAELIISMVPNVDLVRMVSSGTEACMSAVRLARGYTGKNKIIKFVRADRIQSCRRFIEEKYFRIQCHRTGEAGAFSHPATDIRRVEFLKAAQSDKREFEICNIFNL